VGWVDALRGKTVGLDTAPLIYFIEQSPGRIEKLRPFFAAAVANLQADCQSAFPSTFN